MGATLENDLELNLKAHNRMLVVVSPEEDRSIPRIQAVAEKREYVVIIYDCLRGHMPLSKGNVRLPGDGRCTNLPQALNAVAEYKHTKALFIFRDLFETASRIERMPDFVTLCRQLKELYVVLKQGENAVVFLSSTASIPPELEDCLTLIEAPLPGYEERLSIILRWIQTNCQGIPCDASEEVMHRIATASAGMTSRQIQAALAMSVVRRKGLAPDVVADMVAEKVIAVRKTELLECVQSDIKTSEIGGLAGIKDFVGKRALAFSTAASRYGLPKPKGILIVGPPGTGKSLMAKSTAQDLGMGLIRFDVGRIFGSLVGQSEERMRCAMGIVEIQAPCVLWIDEIEKAFAGASGPAGDSGVAQRTFGYLLTWMSDRKAPVFIVATANNVRQLPPEFLRKGRFDELFFVDLPVPSERRAILEVQLRKYGQPARGLITDSLISKLDRFSGAEIENAIIEAMYEAFYADQRAITAADLEAAAGRTIPIADQMRSEIEELRRWGRANARPAC